MAVSAMECSLAKSSAPPSVRKQPLTFCFYLYLPYPSLAGIVVIGYMRVCEKSEQIVFYFEDAFPETLKFLVEVRKAFTKSFFILVFSVFIFIFVILPARLRSMACDISWTNLRDQSCSASSSLRYSAFRSSWTRQTWWSLTFILNGRLEDVATGNVRAV